MRREELGKIPPSIRQIQRLHGWDDVKTAATHIRRMVKKGLLKKVPVFGDTRDASRKYAYKITMAGKLHYLECLASFDPLFEVDEEFYIRLASFRSEAARLARRQARRRTLLARRYSGDELPDG